MASLNKVILMGNLTADPELKVTPSGVSVTSFSIAVGRRFAKPNDEIQADFINIVAWRGTAEFICKYFTKGKSIVVVGQLQTRSYTAQDGSKRYITEVVAEEVTFGSGALSGTETQKRDVSTAPGAVQPAFTESANYEDVAPDDDLPF